MSWTKKQLIEAGYGSIGLTKFAFSLTPEMVGEGLNALDSMMAAWAAQKGIRIGYNGATDQSGSSADDESGIPDHAYEAVYLCLGERVGGTIGKSLPPDKQVLKMQALDALISYCQSNNIPEMQRIATMPRGSGNKPEQNGVGAIFYQPTERIDDGTGGGFVDGGDGAPLTP